MKKKSTQSISVIQRKIWDECKRIIRARYPHVCYTCGKTGLVGSNLHTGHLFSKASLGAFLKYDLRVLRPQCYNCNINRGGAGADFYARMLKENGKRYMDKLQQDRQISVEAIDHYMKILEEYKTIEK